MSGQPVILAYKQTSDHPEVEQLCDRIVRRAGYDPLKPVHVNGGAFDFEFRAILETLAYIGARKTDDYGDFRQHDIRSWTREVYGCYWDIQRKFGRLDQQLGHVLPEDEGGGPIDIEAIMETLADQAVYCVRMIQILKRLEDKGLVPK